MSSKAMKLTKTDEHSNYVTVGKCEGTVCIVTNCVGVLLKLLSSSDVVGLGVHFMFTLNISGLHRERVCTGGLLAIMPVSPLV